MTCCIEHLLKASCHSLECASAGGVVGGAVGLSLLIGLLFWAMRSKQKQTVLHKPGKQDESEFTEAAIDSEVRHFLNGIQLRLTQCNNWLFLGSLLWMWYQRVIATKVENTESC